MTKHVDVELGGQTVSNMFDQTAIEPQNACTPKNCPIKTRTKEIFDGIQILSNTIKLNETAPNEMYKWEEV